jgi:dTDP-4-amino-4,6-dideoxygalactose transaminase
MINISKRAENKAKHSRYYLPYESARVAMHRFLETITWLPDDVILMPAYIGWSKREGSGVLDPVTALGLKPIFYKLDDNLSVDVADVQRKIAVYRPRVVLFIHYFGFVDPQFTRLVKLCREAGSIVIEDAAHAMLTDVIGGRCGREGDACLYSLHKILPHESGGALVLNQPAAGASLSKLLCGNEDRWREGPWNYDLFRIAEARRCNAETLTKLIRDADLPLDLLHPVIDIGIVPQTLPIKMRSGGRDQLYEDMNAAGFGVTSLYHTLVSAIPHDEFAVCVDLSRRIMNLPVHQDIDPTQLSSLVAALEYFLNRR